MTVGVFGVSVGMWVDEYGHMGMSIEAVPGQNPHVLHRTRPKSAAGECSTLAERVIISACTGLESGQLAVLHGTRPVPAWAEREREKLDESC